MALVERLREVEQRADGAMRENAGLKADVERLSAQLREVGSRRCVSGGPSSLSPSPCPRPGLCVPLVPLRLRHRSSLTAWQILPCHVIDKNFEPSCM